MNRISERYFATTCTLVSAMSIIFVNAYETDNDTMHGPSREAHAAGDFGRGISGCGQHAQADS
jgi:hypothetical protein